MNLPAQEEMDLAKARPELHPLFSLHTSCTFLLSVVCHSHNSPAVRGEFPAAPFRQLDRLANEQIITVMACSQIVYNILGVRGIIPERSAPRPVPT